MNIAQNIYNLRMSLGLKQSGFAKEISGLMCDKYIYDEKVISKWERGESIPRLETLIAICKEYNLSLDELLKDEIKEFVSRSSFSSSDEKILNEFLDNRFVCIKKNGKYISAFDENLYRYGQLSYLANNLVEYRSEMSRNFSFTNPTKEVQVVVGILDINDGKRELHYLGTKEDDIVSIEYIPSKYSEITIKNNNIIDHITYNEVFNNECSHIIKLGSGKTYIISGECTKYNHQDYKFTEDNTPHDLDDYGLNKKDYDWLDYAYTRRDCITDDSNIFDEFGGDIRFYKNVGIFEIIIFGKIKCTDAQLIKILTDDYKHRLIRALENLSDNSIYEKYIKESENYLKKMFNKLSNKT